MKTYAKTEWTASDVKTVAPAWTIDQCEEWLEDNAKYIADRLVELGWNVIEDLLPPEAKDEEGE